MFVIQNNKAIKTFVKVSGYANGFAEITEGLNIGDVVVSEGQQKLSGGETVNVINATDDTKTKPSTLNIVKQVDHP